MSDFYPLEIKRREQKNVKNVLINFFYKKTFVNVYCMYA